MANNELVQVNPEAFRRMYSLGRIQTEFGQRSALLAVTYDESGRVTRRMGVTIPTHSIHDRMQPDYSDGEIIDDIPEIET